MLFQRTNYKKNNQNSQNNTKMCGYKKRIERGKKRDKLRR